MDYKHACVIDAENLYKTFVLVLMVEQEGQREAQPQHYTLAEGERLVDAAPPTLRPHAGAGGFVSPRWDADSAGWVEATTGEEIAAWEAGHSDPNAKTVAELAGKVESTASGNIHVLDIGAAEFDPTAMDFSQYAAGDVILVVSDAVVEEAVQGGAGGT